MLDSEEELKDAMHNDFRSAPFLVLFVAGTQTNEHQIVSARLRGPTQSSLRRELLYLRIDKLAQSAAAGVNG